MDKEFNKIIAQATPDQAAVNELLGRLFEVARPTAVFGDPVISGEYTVITASEVTAGFGAGFGGGVGFGPEEEEEEGEPVGGGGGGGGGGGTTTARPVAAISIGPDGVHVEPIVDPTKISLAFFTVIGAIFMMIGKIRRFQQKQKLE